MTVMHNCTDEAHCPHGLQMVSACLRHGILYLHLLFGDDEMTKTIEDIRGLLGIQS